MDDCATVPRLPASIIIPGLTRCPLPPDPRSLRPRDHADAFTIVRSGLHAFVRAPRQNRRPCTTWQWRCEAPASTCDRPTPGVYRQRVRASLRVHPCPQAIAVDQEDSGQASPMRIAVRPPRHRNRGAGVRGNVMTKHDPIRLLGYVVSCVSGGYGLFCICANLAMLQA